MARRSKNAASIAIAPSTLPEGAPMSGHSRVWTSCRAALDSLSVLDHSGNPDVWFFSAHGGRPEVEGLCVAVAYEAGWTVPGAYVGYPSSYLESINAATRAGVTHADAVVVGAESAKREIVEAYGLSPDTVHVVAFGVDLETFHPRNRHDSATLPGLEELPNAPLIAFVNSLAPRKNVGLVRDAVEQLLHEGYPHHLVMVGNAAKHLGGDVEEIERAAFSQFQSVKNRVIRLRGLDDQALAALLANASVLCAPSSHEGFGLTVLEAMASGTPVVAAARGALPEVVGTGGLLVEPELADLVAALKVVLNGDEATWRKSARDQASLFPWERTALGWSKVANDLADRIRKRGRWFS